MISPEPDTVSFELDGSEYLLMLACDGVWDMFHDTEVYNHIKQFVSSSSPKGERSSLLYAFVIFNEYHQTG